jgi:hypothetical protein
VGDYALEFQSGAAKDFGEVLGLRAAPGWNVRE